MNRPATSPPRSWLIRSSATGPTADRVVSTLVHGRLYVCQPDWSIPPMRLAYDGLFFIVEGRGWVQVNDDRIEVSPGWITFIRVGDRLAAGHDPSHPIRTYSIGFTLRTADGDDLFGRRPWPLAYRTTQSQARQWVDAVKPLTDDLQSADTDRQALAHGRLLVAIDTLSRWLSRASASRQIPRTTPATGPDARVVELLRYIDEHLTDPLTTAQLAKKAHVSATHLAYLFHQAGMAAPMDTVRQRRVALARTLLATTDDKISTIARAVGYPDPFHFSRVFRRLEGRSPETYRSSCKHPFGP